MANVMHKSFYGFSLLWVMYTGIQISRFYKYNFWIGVDEY